MHHGMYQKAGYSLQQLLGHHAKLAGLVDQRGELMQFVHRCSYHCDYQLRFPMRQIGVACQKLFVMKWESHVERIGYGYFP